ncbi:MAG: SDR family oxidoreductase, partial [Algicola sp.]|nr:SDR family oxidoreductase [Algicola sp.]
GIPLTIYRLRHIPGHSLTGVSNTQNEHFLPFVKGCIQMGYAPSDGYSIELMPVDTVCRLIVEFSQRPTNAGKVIHLENPHSISWRQYLSWFTDTGYEVTFLPNQQWFEKLMHIDQSNALIRLVSFYSDPVYQQKMVQTTHIDCETANMQVLLGQLGITIPSADALKEAHVAYLTGGILSDITADITADIPHSFSHGQN